MLAVLDMTLHHRAPDLSYKKVGVLREALTEAQLEDKRIGIPIDADMSRYDRMFFRKVEKFCWLRLDLASIRRR